MDTKMQYLEIEAAIRKIEPRLGHHSLESLIKPEDQFLQIYVGEKVIRTIREEDADLMWHAGTATLKSYFEHVMKGA